MCSGGSDSFFLGAAGWDLEGRLPKLFYQLLGDTRAVVVDDEAFTAVPAPGGFYHFFPFLRVCEGDVKAKSGWGQQTPAPCCGSPYF